MDHQSPVSSIRKSKYTFDKRIKPFSRREMEVLLLMADGLGSKQIADKLKVTILTIQTHRRNMQIRYHCANAAALINFPGELQSKYINIFPDEIR